MEHPLLEEAVGLNDAKSCDRVGNPVALSAGNKFQQETDFPRVGISPIEFVRYHNSLGYVSRSFANYWTHTYDRFVEIPADPQVDPVKVIRPDGKKINFTWNGVGYDPLPGTHASLEETPNGWRFTDEDLAIETFDADGFLVDITDILGRVQTATYDASNRLIRIQDNLGGSLDFTYDGNGRLATVTDQAGRKWTYRYEILGRLGFVDNPDGTTRQYHYEDLHHAYALTGITDDNGWRYSYYEYDEAGLAIASYHAGGADRVDIQYDANGDRIVLDPLGNATVYSTRIENKRGILDAISGPICSQGCGLSDTQYTYDADYNITSKTSYGVTTQFGNYDSKGQPGFFIEAVGTPDERRTDYQYDPSFFNKITQITEPSVYPGASKVTTRNYDFTGNLLSETVAGFDPFGQAVSRTITNTFNGPFGQISSTDGPRTDVSDITTYEYYPNTQADGANRARLKAVIDPSGIRVRDNIVYSATGKILSELRPNGVTVTYLYVAGNDRIASVTESAGANFNRTQWQYARAGQVIWITLDDEAGNEVISHFSYNAAGRLDRVESRLTVGVSGSAKQWETYQFDAAGNITQETRFSSGASPNLVIDKVFDAYGRIDTITQGGIVEDYDYNPDGTLAAKVDGNQNASTYTYDSFKRLTNTEQVGQVNTAVTYDVQGNTTSVTDPAGNATQYLYDDLGNLVQQDSPDTGITTYTFNAAGQVVAETDAKGQVTVHSYDAIGRVTSVDRTGTDYDITYVFDACTNGTGRLCAIQTGWGHIIQYGWNAVGELNGVTTNEGQLQYTYGPRGALTSIEYPSGRKVLFDIDGGGLPTQIRLQYGALPEVILVQDIEYSPLQRPEFWRFANGQTVRMTLDARHRPTAINAPGVWSWQASQYDGNDNIQSLTNSNDSFTYTYDAYDRLTGAVGMADAFSYAYDAVGNRLSKTVNGLAATGTYELGSNRIAGFGDVQYALDPNGNTVSTTDSQGPDLTYLYSGHNRLTEVIDAATATSLATYRYDGLGQRVTKTTAGGTTRFLYGPSGELLVEMDGAGNILHEYVYLGGQAVVDLYEVPPGPPPTPPSELVIDDSQARVVGANWQVKSSSAAVNGTYIENRKRLDRAVEWTITDPDFVAGPYDVYVKWLEPPGGFSTKYHVSYNGDSDTVSVLHAEHSYGDWVLLGNFQFAAPGGWTQGITLSGFYNELGWEGTFLEADAVKLVPTFAPEGALDLHYIFSDHLGTPQRVTDEAGTVVWTATHRPFGAAVVDEDPDADLQDYTLNLRFPGQYFDQETGLHYNYFRDYDPQTGRYVTSDPIGIGGGLNSYVYALGNPLRWYDSNGLQPSCKGWWQYVGFNPQIPRLLRLCTCYWLCRDCDFPVAWKGIKETLPSTTGQLYFDPTVRGPGAGDIKAGNACLCSNKPGPETGCDSGKCG